MVGGSALGASFAVPGVLSLSPGRSFCCILRLLLRLMLCSLFHPGCRKQQGFLVLLQVLFLQAGDAHLDVQKRICTVGVGKLSGLLKKSPVSWVSRSGGFRLLQRLFRLRQVPEAPGSILHQPCGRCDMDLQVLCPPGHAHENPVQHAGCTLQQCSRHLP